MKILLIEDDQETALTIKDALKKQFIVEIAYSGNDGEYKAFVEGFDLIILDLVLPDISGIEVCRKLRSYGIKSPILMLTGQMEIDKRVKALDSGADDFVTKPFHIEELHARIRALLRRHSENVHSNVLTVSDLSFDVSKKTVRRKGTDIVLRRKELYLLEYLMRNAGQIVTRDMILDHVWESSNESMTNIVDVHIKYLRDKVDKPFHKRLIKTVHGIGYKLEA